MTNSTNQTTTFLVLHGGTPPINKDFYVRIKRHVLDRLPTLRSGVPSELKQICSPEFWGTLTEGEHRTAGICVANMVAHSEIPLITAPHKHEYPKKYRRA